MRCPTLHELPKPPDGRTGWPWTEESEQPPGCMPDGSPWPKVSIVTPSYDQGEFIEETIRSVLLQGYPDLEYIVMDGGSQDNSIEIIKKYEKWLTFWTSEKDRGQSQALNKGFGHASGEIYAWMNSDDFYFMNSLKKIVGCMDLKSNVILWIGQTRQIDDDGKTLPFVKSYGLERRKLANWWNEGWFHQPGCFFSADAFKSVNGIDERLDFALDVDLWLRILETGNIKEVDDLIAVAREHKDSKTIKYSHLSEAELYIVDILNGYGSVAKNRMRCYFPKRPEFIFNIKFSILQYSIRNGHISAARNKIGSIIKNNK